MATVSLQKVRKSYGSLTVIDDLSLDVADEEFLVLLGPSGCGKTTTMRMIAGLEDISAGDLFIDGQRMNDAPARTRDLAMVFQNYGLYPHMTVADNIGYPLKVQGVSKADRAPRIEAAADKVELKPYLKRRPAELSGGQRQRVALARAIVRTPRLFLMDEPLSNLDAKLRTQMRAEIKHLQRDLATTTIYVTHDQVEAMTLADRIVVMNGGRIEQQGTPAAIYARPASTFVAAFIGAPPMNLLSGTIDAEGFHHPGGHITGLRPDLAGPIVFGQRAEDLKLCDAGSGDFDGEVFSCELLGDATLVVVRLSKDLVTVKVPPEEGRRMGERVGIKADRTRIHLFDARTGARADGLCG